MYDSVNVFTKENLDFYLKKLGKEFRRLNGNKMQAEIILIGGASVLVNYGFRDNTYDIDAVVRASSAMKEAINRVGDDMGLPNGWFNSDFTKTKSYTPKLYQYSQFYKTFSNVLNVRTVSGKYLVAMKLMAWRQYKNDMSDVVGILWEEKQKGNPIYFHDIDRAVCDLYGSWEALPDEAIPEIESILNSDNLEALYHIYRDTEMETKQALINFEGNYPDIVTEGNIGDIIAKLEKSIKNGQVIGCSQEPSEQSQSCQSMKNQTDKSKID